MSLKLTDFDPHFLKRVSPVDYEHTDDIHEAGGLQLECPLCRGPIGHTVILWRDPERWQFVGRSYKDLSLMAGRIMVTLTGGCGGRFHIKNGRVDSF